LTCTTTSTSCTLNNAVPGTSYSITVFATNGIGNSLPTSPVVGRAANSVPVWGDSDPPPTVVAGNSSLTVSWSAPSTNGGSAITSYIAAADVNISNSPSFSCQTTSFSCTITGLTNGTRYSVWVWAVNSVGRSGTSSSPFAVPVSTKPGPPTNVTATFEGASMVLSWLAPISDGGSPITSYTATISGGANPIVCQSSNLTCAVLGTIVGTKYSISVTATNMKGTSIASDQILVGVPNAVPGAPTNVVVRPTADATLSVSWQSPVFTGGSAIGSYTVTLTGGGSEFHCTTVNTSCPITGLTDGVTYTATVVATNSVGNSAVATAVSSVASSLPSAPSGVTTSIVGSLLHVTWNASTVIGNSPVLRYSVSATSGSESLNCSGNFGYTSCDIAGAIPGTSYKITVSAINSIGTTSSSAVNGLIPAIPSPPSSLQTSATSSQIIVSWGPPGTDGGSEISSYVLTLKVNGATFSRTVDGQTFRYVFESMPSSTGYEVSVAALNLIGSSPSSLLSFGTTLPSPTSPSNQKPVVIAPAKKPIPINQYSVPATNGLEQYKAWELKFRAAINVLQSHFSIYSSEVMKLGNKKVWTQKVVSMFNSDASTIANLNPPTSSKNFEKIVNAEESLSHALLSLNCYGTAMYGRSCNGLSGSQYLVGAAALVSATFAYLRSTVNESTGLEGCRSCIAI